MEDELGEVVCTAPIENDRHAEEFKFFSNCNNIKGVRFKFFLIYLFLAMLGLVCCDGFCLVVASRGYSLVVCGILTGVTFLVAEPGP